MRWSSRASRLLAAVGVASALVLSSAQTPPAATPSPVPEAAPQAEKPLLILIDAAHGGSDPGALLTPTALEKNITLNLARRLRQELNARGIACELVRDGDVTLSADQRATMVNTGDTSLYIALHASSLGSGIRVFTSMLPASAGGKGTFVDWNTAQASALERSRAIQQQLIAAIQKIHFPTRSLVAPLRPLNNIKSPAIAIEIAPTTGNAAQVSSSGYQAMICSAVANALASMGPALHANVGARP